MSEADVAPPGEAFAQLMSGAAEQAAPEAPYGYTRDRGTGQMRPKRSPGRGGVRKPPSVDELRAPQAVTVEAADGDGGAADGPDDSRAPAAPPADRAPQEARKLSRKQKAAPDTPVPSYKPGVITSGVNRLYRRAGKIVRAMDADIGEAILEAAKNIADPGEPDDSVGAAWEELARTNPRIRRFVMKCLTGGAWGQLVMAHAPIGMAIIMKPAILRHIPFQGLVSSMAEPDEDTPPGEGGLPGGMTEADAHQVTELARQQMAKMGLSVSPEMAAQMAQAAQSMMNGAGAVPKAQVRNQPRRAGSRADRRASLRRLRRRRDAGPAR